MIRARESAREADERCFSSSASILKDVVPCCTLVGINACAKRRRRNVGARHASGFFRASCRRGPLADRSACALSTIWRHHHLKRGPTRRGLSSAASAMGFFSADKSGNPAYILVEKVRRRRRTHSSPARRLFADASRRRTSTPRPRESFPGAFGGFPDATGARGERREGSRSEGGKSLREGSPSARGVAPDAVLRAPAPSRSSLP